MSPEPGVEMAFRNATLSLAVDMPFARKVVNAGRLSVPCKLTNSSLNSADETGFDVPMQVGMVAQDAPIIKMDGHADWLTCQLGGKFCLLTIGNQQPDLAGLNSDIHVIHVGHDGLADCEGKVEARYGQGVYLIRPDQHVAARWQNATVADIHSALTRCTAPATVAA